MTKETTDALRIVAVALSLPEDSREKFLRDVANRLDAAREESEREHCGCGRGCPGFVGCGGTYRSEDL